MKARIAVIDDEPIVCRRLQRALLKEGYEVECFGEGSSFLQRLPTHPFDIVFTDLRMPGIDGLEVLRQARSLKPGCEVIVFTGHGSMDTAIQAIKQGAYYYVAKPFQLQEITHLADSALEKIKLKEENRRLKKEVERQSSFQRFIGASPAMRELYSMIQKVALVECNVLIEGESGTGKQLAARAIHDLSPRAERPFVAFNCGGFSEDLIANELFGHERGSYTGASATKIGLLESAAHGTVFLDEVGEMPLSMQVKLLHVLQDKRIMRVGGTKPISLDIRIISATNRDMKNAVAEGMVREDLFYRLNVVTLRLPRLSERREDIPLLAAHFSQRYSQACGKAEPRISAEAMELLMSYSFPGNVRELENIIERAVALCDNRIVRVADLPPDLRDLEFRTYEGEELQSLEEIERRHIAKVITKTGNNKGLACEILGMPRTTLWRKLKKFGLED
ncbi:sigma-54-dependent transcriptional regulator [Desulfoferula mesophila]|uniref:Sigma-54-dependent Fis family transcriptional regulator n=1 Tax=Desulfoferula mesophila TaxID=3058419 RepID=A0AAU9EYA2_9BACT|nr:sigma-54-dependent Fis family transcriptional regulator [Desulfoferula mesophilus]